MTPEFYRAEAERCRQQAAQQTDSEEAQRLRNMAADYDVLADELERAKRG